MKEHLVIVDLLVNYMKKNDPYKTWNKCEVCGKFISYQDIIDGKATHVCIEPDNYFSSERWKTLCKKHTSIG